MTRPCGCGGNASLTCQCVIVPGPNTTVTGTGIPEDPYVITGSVTQLLVTDTSTLDLTLAGDGSATPYNLSGQVRLTASNENLLEITPTGLLVSCVDVQACVGAAMGPGLAWDAANRQYSARLSPEPGNILVIAPDGGLYASSDGTIAPAQPRARVGKATAQPIPSSGSSSTLVLFDQPITDNAGLHTAVGRLTAPVAGGYTVGTTIQWQSLPPNDGLRGVYLRRNGTQLIAADQRDAVIGATAIQNISTSLNLNAGDYVEVLVQQTDTSGTLNLLASPGFVPVMWMYYVTEGV